MLPKIPTANVPQIPQNKCTGIAPTGSSSSALSNREELKNTTGPEIIQIRIELPGNIKSAPAVIPTNPPSTPFINIIISAFP